MKNYYPINLDLAQKKCLLVGGGKVATRKVATLLTCQAKVQVISCCLTEHLQKLAEEGQILWQKRAFQNADLQDVFLVIAATDQADVNEQIAKEALTKGILVNVVDNSELSSFLVPATHRQGLLSISVSTSGASPALSAKICRELAQEYGQEYKQFLQILQQLRPEIIERFNKQAERKKIFASLVDSDILDLLREGKLEKVKERIAECIC